MRFCCRSRWWIRNTWPCRRGRPSCTCPPWSCPDTPAGSCPLAGLAACTAASCRRRAVERWGWPSPCPRCQGLCREPFTNNQTLLANFLLKNESYWNLVYSVFMGHFRIGEILNKPNFRLFGNFEEKHLKHHFATHTLQPRIVCVFKYNYCTLKMYLRLLY